MNTRPARRRPSLYGLGACLSATAGVAALVSIFLDARAVSQTGTRLGTPSLTHPFGTTRTGLDVLSRTLVGARLGLEVVLVATILAVAVGVSLGLVSGYLGGRWDRLLLGVMDAVYAFPGLLLAIVVAFLLEGYVARGVPSAAAAVSLIYVPQYFRSVRNQVVTIREETYVEAARVAGLPSGTIVRRYILPNVAGSVPVLVTLNAADAILTLAALGFVGLGVQPPNPEWGYDIAQAASDLASGAWWTSVFPGLAVVASVTGLSLLGESLAEGLGRRRSVQPVDDAHGTEMSRAV